MIHEYFSWDECTLWTFKLFISKQLSICHYLIWELVEINITNLIYISFVLLKYIFAINDINISFVFICAEWQIWAFEARISTTSRGEYASLSDSGCFKHGFTARQCHIAVEDVSIINKGFDGIPFFFRKKKRVPFKVWILINLLWLGTSEYCIKCGFMSL